MTTTEHQRRAGDLTEHAVCTIVGDRLCVRCGYNLVGQPVARDTAYGILIARCPECGTAAALQEYPLLGRWANRWAALLAAAWFAVCVLLVAASAGLLYGLSEGIVTNASEPLGRFMAERQKHWLEQQLAQGTLPPNTDWLLTQPPTIYTIAEPTWLSLHDPEALLAEAGGWWEATGFRALWGWPGITVWVFVTGVFWSVALLHLRRPFLLLFGVLLLVLAALPVVSSFSPMGLVMPGIGGWVPMQHVARRQIGPGIHAMTLGFSALVLAAGLLLGRSTVRGLVRALLPPRLRGSLAILWTADGKKPK